MKTSNTIAVGQQYGRWTVRAYVGKNAKFRIFWLCECDCGTIRPVWSNNLLKGLSQSCGCYRISQLRKKRRTHGESRGTATGTVEYTAYLQAKGRCTNPKHQSYAYYGGRGIEFRFESYEEFLNAVGRRPSSAHSLDRIDNDGHYEVGNAKWSTKKEQSRNSRGARPITIDGVTKLFVDWAVYANLHPSTLAHRLRSENCCNSCAVSLPLRQQCPHRLP